MGTVSTTDAGASAASAVGVHAARPSIAGSMRAALSAVVWRARRRVRCIVRILYVSCGAGVAPPFGPGRGLIQRASGSREAAVRRALDPYSGLGREQHRDRREDREDD